MDRHERIEVVTERLQDAINHLVMEYRITLAEMVGVLEMQKYTFIPKPQEILSKFYY